MKRHEVKISMDGKGRALDNIYIERFWRTIKYDHIYLNPAKSGLELYQGIDEFIKGYNRRKHQGTDRVKRNSSRFPEDFMFQLSMEEFKILRSQIVTSSWGGRRSPPYAFTEHGTVMLASILKSQTAVDVSIQIVKAFVKFRELLTSQTELAKKVDGLENRYNSQFKQVFEAIRQLMTNKTQITSIKKGRKD